MLTGVIYGAIVLVWAAYLVPLALRRHDEATRTRSIAGFSSAMRVLARRTTAGSTAMARSARSVVTPRRNVERVVAPQSASAPRPTAPRPAGPQRAAERAAAARRRRVLEVLVALLALTALLHLVHVLPLLTVLVPVALIVAFLAISRATVRRANEAYWAAVAAGPQAEEPQSVVVRRTAARVDRARPVEEHAEPAVTVAQRDEADPETEQHVEAVPLATSDGGSLWDPLPVTLPTYVGASVAPRTQRAVDIGAAAQRGAARAASAAQAPRPLSGSSAAETVSEPVEDVEVTAEVPRVANA